MISYNILDKKNKIKHINLKSLIEVKEKIIFLNSINLCEEYFIYMVSSNKEYLFFDSSEMKIQDLIL